MSPARRRRLGRTALLLLLAPAFLLGRTSTGNDWVLSSVVVATVLGWGVFTMLLLGCLDLANGERNIAVKERDIAYRSRDQVYVWAKHLIATSEQVADAARQIRQENRAYLTGDPWVMEQLVAKARRRGADIEYIPLADLDAVPEQRRD